MVNFYDILKVKRTASPAEIKSAYRKLARKYHPDVNGGTERAAREFARISRAYHTLIDPQERAYHDSQLRRAESGDFVGGSVFHTDNQHAQRLRRIAIQRRFDRRVDQIIEADRRENFALQKAVFTTVALFLSTFFVAWFKPLFWNNLQLFGRATIITLSFVGLWHLAVRLKAVFEHYTYDPKSIHDSITGDGEGYPDKPFTRFAASTFLILGPLVSTAVGHFFRAQTQHMFIFSDMPKTFGQHFTYDLLFYPPIAVLIVDTMHSMASRID
ncbi:MAG TPA: DnaJ domain-containing protein [Pyrinomonadaceae bacterium]|nr:DnaJ domain-containing protein [Pyrinomonadaceae bacterium]